MEDFLPWIVENILELLMNSLMSPIPSVSMQDFALPQIHRDIGASRDPD